MNSTREEALFQLVLSKPAAKRAAWRHAECEGDDALRQHLDALLAARETPDEPQFTRAASKTGGGRWAVGLGPHLAGVTEHETPRTNVKG